MIRLLHVDDDSVILELAGLFLSKAGDFSVDTATSGESAIGMLSRQEYDAIVSDYTMPGCSGLELLKYVREKDKNTPFLIFSDYNDEEVVIDALTSGADFFLPKGLHVRSQFIQLEHAIRESVMRRRAEKQHDDVSARLKVMEAAIRGSPHPLCFCDIYGRIRFANRASIELWGYSDDTEIIGKHAIEFVCSPEIDTRAIPDLLTMKGWSGQAVALRKDRSTFDAQVHVNVIHDDSGIPLGFIASFTDITLQKETRSRLEAYIRAMRFVSEKASELAEFPLDGDIYSFIADSLARLAPEGSAVLVSSVQPGPVLRLESVRADREIIAEATRIIGRPLEGLEFDLPAEKQDLSFPPVFVDIAGGIKELSFGRIPDETCKKLEETGSFGRITGSGLVWGGKTHAVTVLLLPRGSHLENTDVLNLFTLHCSAVLQRREAERMLRNLRTG